MSLFDNIAGFFNGGNAQDAADAQKAGLQAGYGQASGLLGQGRDALTSNLEQGRGALTSNYTAALQPFLQNYQTAQGGYNAYADATGANGAPGSTRAVSAFQTDPGYQFRINQGNENVLRNSSRTGQGNSGNVNVDLLNYGQGQANQGWQQYIQNLLPFLGQANNAASGIAGVDTGLGSGLNANYGAAGTGLNTSYGTQANAAYGTQTGMGNADANADLAKNSGVANLFGALGNIAGSAFNLAGGGGFAGGLSKMMGGGDSTYSGADNLAAGGWSPQNPGNSAYAAKSLLTTSDERLKEAIEPIGELFDGQHVYRYNYIGDPMPRIGLLAQEVEVRHPEAVGDVGGGFKGVNYKDATNYAAKLAEFL